MKQQILALAILSACSSMASAQSSVTMYGMVDMGVVRESGGAAGSVTKLTSGVENGSRIGFRGTEDLGGGNSAIFLLESGFQADTGAMGQGGLLFGRQAYVGLAGNWGTLTLGRQYAPNYTTMTTVGDPFVAGLAGVFSSVFANSGARMNNAVKYVSPKFNGLSGEVVYGAGEVAGDNSASSVAGAALAYSAGAFNLRVGYHHRDNDTATVKNLSAARNTLLAMNYDWKIVKGFFAYGINKGLNSSQLANPNAYGLAVAARPSTDSRDLLLGVTVPVGPGRMIASYIHKDDRTAFNQDASQYAIGYSYLLSKRTDLYAAYGKISNENGASYTVNSAIDTGSGNRAFNLGMRHLF